LSYAADKQTDRKTDGGEHSTLAVGNNNNDDRETSFLFQRISVLLFWFNSVLLHDGFVLDDRPER